MGGPGARSMSHMFGRFQFEKTIDEIKAAMLTKIEFLTAKISERKARIAAIRREFDISDEALIQVLSQAVDAGKASSNMSYTLPTTDGSTKLIGAGVVQNILTENHHIEQEKEICDKMRSILRNLRPVVHHTSDGGSWKQTSWTLTDDEIEFLGF